MADFAYFATIFVNFVRGLHILKLKLLILKLPLCPRSNGLPHETLEGKTEGGITAEPTLAGKFLSGKSLVRSKHSDRCGWCPPPC